MLLEKYTIEEHNDALSASHKNRIDFLKSEVKGHDEILQKLIDFQVAIPKLGARNRWYKVWPFLQRGRTPQSRGENGRCRIAAFSE